MVQFIKTLVMIELLLICGMLLYRLALARQYRFALSPKVVAILMMTPVVALMQHNPLIFYAYLTAVVAFAPRSRAELCSIYVLLLPMTPLLAYETAAGAIYLFPLSAVAAINLGGLVGILIRSSGRSYSRPLYDVLVAALIVMFVYIDGRDVSVTSIFRSVIVFTIAFGGPYLVMSRGIRSREDVDLILLRLGLSGTITAIVAIFETTRHWVLFQSYNLSLHVAIPLQSATLAMRGGRLRTGGPIVDYSVAGIFLAVVLITLPYLKSRFRVPYFWAIAAIIVTGLLATQSRGAWLALAFGALVLLLYRGKWLRASIAAVAMATLQFVLSTVLEGDSGLAESIGVGGAAQWTADYRKDLFTLGMQQVYAHPIFGQSPKVLVIKLSALTQGQHIVDFVNSHLYIAMAAGVPFFLVWMIIWGSPAFGALRYRAVRHPDGNLAELPLGMLAVVMVAIAATSTVDRNLTWPTLALGMAGPCFALATQRGRRAPPVPRKPLVVMPPTDRDRPSPVVG